MAGPFEIRDPIHGFVELDDWEREIVNHPVFQRLRRIRQLGLTDMVYPGATHSRFEHSLGVMHIATRMFDAIVSRRRDFLEATYNYDDVGLARDRRILRLAALLHDVGHAPFSHGAEDLMPEFEKDKQYTHEDYSAAIVAKVMRDVIESHPFNQNHDIKAQDIADFLAGKPSVGRRLFWTNLVDGQLDADRADYLLRDSYHVGVRYGHFDLDRLLTTLTAIEDPETGSPVLAIEEGGQHAAEGLIIARYMMFTQVYYHRTRRAYDKHLIAVMRTLLAESEGLFPPPCDIGNLEYYLKWDDWLVFGQLADFNGGVDGEAILGRSHDRCVFETPERPEGDDLYFLENVRARLGDDVSFVDQTEKSWYTPGDTDIWIIPRTKRKEAQKLSQLSPVVEGLKEVSQSRIYVPVAIRQKCQQIVDQEEAARKTRE